MSYQIIAPGACTADIELPASKSISNRALILNALSYSPYPITNLSDCDDTRVMVQALDSNSNYFDIHAAGTAMRFLTAFLSKIVGEWVITGSDRMKQRPIGLLVDALRELGARIDYLEKEGFPPLKIQGSALMGGDLTLPGNVSSQYISALLMIAPYMEKGLTLNLTGKVISQPYIRMTLQMMEEAGVKAIYNGSTIRILPAEYKPILFKVESDWSAASYWYEIAALAPKIDLTLMGLNKKSVQGDAQIASFFEPLGISSLFTQKGVTLRKNGEVTKKLVFDLADQPDLAQTLVVTSALKGIPFRFTGLQSLRIKETDRLKALQTELRKLGYIIKEINGSILEWNGEIGAVEERPTIDTYDDHRMAMAFAPVALIRNEVIINHPEVVTKSYPSYWEDLRKAGFTINQL